jgi:hypothetical protein
MLLNEQIHNSNQILLGISDEEMPFTVAARYKARGLESHSRHGCLSAFILCLCCSVSR